ncbi:hypothetical protein BDV06DRAFT_197828 [Aspergillus oleicola]
MGLTTTPIDMPLGIDRWGGDGLGTLILGFGPEVEGSWRLVRSSKDAESGAARSEDGDSMG